jgi:hypothetical protein
LSHPLWSSLASAIVVEAGTLLATGRKHRRLELPVHDMPDERVKAILAMRVPCAACGAPMQPFRPRKGKSAGRAERPGRLFLALTCALEDRFGCARGHAASDATERVIRAIAASKRKPTQLDLFARKR